METSFSTEDAFAIVKRRWLLFVLLPIPFILIAALVAVAMPKTYRSTARILVESQQIPQDLARSTVTASPNERIRLIEQRLMTRQNLLDMAARHDVFAGRTDMSPTAVVDAMRGATRIEVIALATQGRGDVTASAFNISFEASNAALTARVANDFLFQIIEQNVRQRNARATNTLEFFNQQVERLGRELTRIDAEIANYKNANDMALPESLEFRRNELSILEERMFERERQRLALEEQLGALQAIRQSGGMISGTQNLSPAEQELARLRQALVQQEAVLASNHPTIRSLSARISALENSLTTTQAASTDEEASAASVSQPLQEIDRQISRVETQLAQLANQRRINEGQVTVLRESIDRTPEVEVTLGAMLREQSNIQLQFEQAIQRQAEAATGEQLEVNQQAERFEVIEQPQVPTEPISPNRPLIVGAGLGGGLAISGVIVLLIEFVFPRLYSARDVQRLVGIRPIVAVSYITTPAERRKGRRSKVIIVGFAFGAIAAILAAIDTFVLPLSLLLERVAMMLRIDVLIAMITQRLGG